MADGRLSIEMALWRIAPLSNGDGKSAISASTERQP